MNVKNNQRFRDSQSRLDSAMLALMEQMEFEKITVKKICETAQVNRSTFYAHYSDIYDMMNQMEEHLNEELLASYSEEDIREAEIFPLWPFIPFLRHIRKHSFFYRIALAQRKSFPLKQGFWPMWNQIIRPFCEQAGITSEEEMMYYFVYFQAGFTMLLKRWVDSGCRESEETMTDIICSCIPSIWKLQTPSS